MAFEIYLLSNVYHLLFSCCFGLRRMSLFNYWSFSDRSYFPKYKITKKYRGLQGFMLKSAKEQNCKTAIRQPGLSGLFGVGPCEGLGDGEGEAGEDAVGRGAEEYLEFAGLYRPELGGGVVKGEG